MVAAAVTDKPGLSQSEKIKAGQAKSPHPLRLAAGRPTVRVKITQEKLDRVIAAISTGLSIESSLVLVGLSRNGVERWLKINPSLRQRFEQAETEWEAGIVKNIHGMSARDLKAGQFLLERRVANRWAPVSKTELTGKDGGPIDMRTVSKQLFASLTNGGELPRMKNVTPVQAKVTA